MSGGLPAVDFRLLGPMEWRVDGVPQPLSGVKPRALLAMLLVNRNRVVASNTLADAIWNDEAPAGYSASLQVYVSTLRRALRTSAAADRVLVTTQAPGYKLSVDEELIDLGRFSRGVAAGQRSLRVRQFAQASEQLQTALDQWSGPALADLRGLRFAEEFAAALEEERLLALQARIEADLQCGRDSTVVAELTTLTGAYPLREPFWVQLITALYRLGRQADALDASRRIRELLSDELGIDPSPALRDLERKILLQESLAGAPPPSPAMQQTVSETAVVFSSARLVLPSGKVVHIPSRGLRIGRMDDNDLVIEGVKVSRYHAVVAEGGAGFVINDLRSTNGILVGGKKVMDSHLLRHKDVITIGGTELVFEADR